jgi:hypothetical protein
VQKLLEVCVYLKNKTWRKKMHETKLLKLLGISLIVGILGLTGFCIKLKSNDNNDLALGAGLVLAQQQAEQAAQAAYEAANNTDNPQWFCALVAKSGTTYNATLTPLVAQDCNLNYFNISTNAFKQKLLDTIDGDADLSANCPLTRDAINNFDFSSFPGGGGSGQVIYVNGRSLLDEVGLSTTDYTVVSPNTYKLIYLLNYIQFFASGTNESGCVNAINSKLNSIESNKFCSNIASNQFGLPVCNSSSGKTKVVYAQCYYGSGAPSGSTICATLDDQF